MRKLIKQKSHFKQNKPNLIKKSVMSVLDQDLEKHNQC